MNSLKKLVPPQFKKKRPTQEELQQDGVRVVISFSSHCSNCSKNVKDCCKRMQGVSKVEDVDASEGEGRLAVIRVFSTENLEKQCKKIPKVIKIIEEKKIGEGEEGAEQEQAEEEIY